MAPDSAHDDVSDELSEDQQEHVTGGATCQARAV